MLPQIDYRLQVHNDRSTSELGQVYHLLKEPMRSKVLLDLELLIRFWITYAQANDHKLDNSRNLYEIALLCVKNNTSEQVADVINIREPSTQITDHFVDRTFARVLRLTKALLAYSYPKLLAEVDFFRYEMTEEEQRILEIFAAFTQLPDKISQLQRKNQTFAEYVEYNPHYIDFLKLFSGGQSVSDLMANCGVQLNSSARFAISESIISAIVRHNFVKSLYPNVEVWTIRSFLPQLLYSEDFVALIQRAAELYLNSPSKSIKRPSETKRFIELCLYFAGVENHLNVSELNTEERNTLLQQHVSELSTTSTLYGVFLGILEYKILNKPIEPYLKILEYNGIVYSSRYLDSIISAGVEFLMGCILANFYGGSDGLTEEALKNWLSRNRNSECIAILKILADAEA